MIYFVTGIGTDVGKTIISAILTEALKADYWKPVQAGNLDSTDSMLVKSLVSNSKTKIHPESYRLKLPASPHYAAAQENITIRLSEIKIPKTDNNLIIEGAGGVMVPLNEKENIIDLIKYLNVKVILVIKNYLGSINHSMLTIQALQSAGITIEGIVFNDEPNLASEKYILENSCLPCIGRIKNEKEINKEVVLKYSSDFKILNDFIP